MATTYVVTATRLDRVDEKTGERKRYYRGDPVTGLSEVDVDRYKRAGAIASSSNDEAKAAKDAPASPNPAETSNPEAASAPIPTGISTPQASDVVAEKNSPPPLERPANAASQEAWAEYAVMTGQLTNEEAAKLKRNEIRDRVK